MPLTFLSFCHILNFGFLLYSSHFVNFASYISSVVVSCFILMLLIRFVENPAKMGCESYFVPQKEDGVTITPIKILMWRTILMIFGVMGFGIVSYSMYTFLNMSLVYPPGIANNLVLSIIFYLATFSALLVHLAAFHIFLYMETYSKCVRVSAFIHSKCETENKISSTNKKTFMKLEDEGNKNE